ncbi:MAG: DUF3696 domain-containing protein [Prolixibacteraceae bacterium]|jgi:predicted ATPase|nr:DUF3696 domain-containing protein [Prolixibacteraceae bacterium]
MNYLKHFGVGNFKVFKNPTQFDLAPITILTGKNNSGKSSLIKSMLILRDSFAEFPKGDIGKMTRLFFDRPELKIGTPDELLNFERKERRITFTLSLNNPIFPNGEIVLEYLSGKKDEVFLFVAFKIINDNETIVNFISPLKELLLQPEAAKPQGFLQIDLQYFLNRIKTLVPDPVKADYQDLSEKLGRYHATLVNISRSLRNNDLLIQEIEDPEFYEEGYGLIQAKKLTLSKEASVDIQKRWFEESKKGVFWYGLVDLYFGYSIHGLDNEFKSQYYQLISDKILEAADQCPLINDDPVYKSFSGSLPQKGIKFFIPKINGDFDMQVKEFILSQFSELQSEFKDVIYLPSIRAKNERLYWVSNEGYAIQAIDQKAFESIYFKNTEIENFYQEFLKDFEIGQKIEIKTHQRTATEITVIRDGRKILLSDLGFGYAQLIPIILNILITASKCFYWKYKGSDTISAENRINERPKILIEEPESNLHPDFQSKLADLFVKASNLFGIQFIIETHSEYLIRRLQYLTARKDIKPDDISIYYFNNPNNIPEGEKQINKIEIRADGILKQDFGSGFYDQAANSTYDLFRLIGDN